MVIYYWLCSLLDQILYNSLYCFFLSLFLIHLFFLSRSLTFLVAFILLSFFPYCVSLFMSVSQILLHVVSDTFLMSLQCTVQQTVTIFRSLIWLTGLNIRNTKNYRVSALKWHLIFAFYFLKTTSLNWSPWQTTHSCNPDWKFTMTAQRHSICPRRCGT